MRRHAVGETSIQLWHVWGSTWRAWPTESDSIGAIGDGLRGSRVRAHRIEHSTCPLLTASTRSRQLPGPAVPFNPGVPHGEMLARQAALSDQSLGSVP